MMRKPTKNTRGANADEKRYHGYLKDLMVCAACCKHRPVINHHCMGATFKHNKTLVGHWFVISLCQECDDIVTNGSRRKFVEVFGPQSKLWEQQINDYEFSTGTIVPFEVKRAITDWGR